MTKRVVVISVALLLLSGCAGSRGVMSADSASDTSAAQNGSGNAQLAPGKHHLERRLGDNVVIDGYLVIPDIHAASIVDVGLVAFDSAKVGQVLFPHEQTTLETFPDNAILRGNQLMTGRDTNASCDFYSDDSVAMTSNLFFTTELSEYVFNVVHWQPEDPSVNLALFSDEAGLPFASRDTALTKVMEAVEGLGVGFTPSSTAIYALDHQTLQKTQDQMIGSGDYEGPKETHWKSAWGVADDCYLVLMDCAVESVPVASFETSSALEDRPFNGSRVVALYSRDGLEFLEVSQLYRVESTAAPVALVPVEDAITTVGAKFASLITATQYRIVSISLVYAPRFKDNSRGSLHLVPAWDFVVHELYADPQSGSTVDYEHHVLVNAQTGKEM